MPVEVVFAPEALSANVTLEASNTAMDSVDVLLEVVPITKRRSTVLTSVWPFALVDSSNVEFEITSTPKGFRAFWAAVTTVRIVGGFHMQLDVHKSLKTFLARQTAILTYTAVHLGRVAFKVRGAGNATVANNATDTLIRGISVPVHFVKMCLYFCRAVENLFTVFTAILEVLVHLFRYLRFEITGFVFGVAVDGFLCNLRFVNLKIILIFIPVIFIFGLTPRSLVVIVAVVIFARDFVFLRNSAITTVLRGRSRCSMVRAIAR